MRGVLRDMAMCERIPSPDPGRSTGKYVAGGGGRIAPQAAHSVATLDTAVHTCRSRNIDLRANTLLYLYCTPETETLLAVLPTARRWVGLLHAVEATSPPKPPSDAFTTALHQLA